MKVDILYCDSDDTLDVSISGMLSGQSVCFKIEAGEAEYLQRALATADVCRSGQYSSTITCESENFEFYRQPDGSVKKVPIFKDDADTPTIAEGKG